MPSTNSGNTASCRVSAPKAITQASPLFASLQRTEEIAKHGRYFRSQVGYVLVCVLILLHH